MPVRAVAMDNKRRLGAFLYEMLLWQHTIPEILSQTMKLQSEANGQMMPLQIGYSNRHLPEKTFDK